MDTPNVTYGLLGRTLGHSWSPQIHARLGSTPYALVEREPDEVRDYLASGSWTGLNVTIPYKRVAAEMADLQSPRVKRLGVANTLVRTAEGIFAENTDVLGFAWLLSRFFEHKVGIPAEAALADAKVLVLGSGGACQAVCAALEDVAPCHIHVISRTGDDTYETLADRHRDARLVVNTTPVGMYPHCPDSPLADATFAALADLLGVIDVVYNPERTGICLQAEAAGIPYQSGLEMLVSQAFYASQLFQHKDLDDSLVEQIEHEIRANQRNIVLIGMPGAGKTSTGRALARVLRRPFIDLDDALEVEAGKSAAAYIVGHGEDAFRKLESEIAARYGAQSGLVIACGGGVVTRARNYAYLHQNGTIVYIDRPLYQLTTSGRPLSQNRGIRQLAAERLGLYQEWADMTISCTGSAQGDAMLVKAKLAL